MSGGDHPQDRPVLRDPAFRRLFAAAASSNFGHMLHAMALPFVAVAVLDATPADIASLGVAGLLPGFLLGLIASAWIDRWPRRPVLIAADIGRAAVVLWIPVGAFLGWLDLFQLHCVVALHGLLGFGFDTAQQALLPRVVPAGRLVEANGRLRAAESVTEGAAFASGGWLIQWWGPPPVMIVDALTFLVSASFLEGLRVEEPRPDRESSRAASSLMAEIREGLGYVARSPVVRPGVIAAALAAMSWRIAGVVYLIYVYETLRFEPSSLGFVFAAGSIASFVGAWAAPRITTRLGVGGSMALAAAGFGVVNWLLPFASGPTLIGAILLVTHQLGDAFAVIFDVNQASVLQRATPDALLGRVSGAAGFLVNGAMLLGLAVGGFAGEWLGLGATLWLAGAVGLLAALVVVSSRLRRVHALLEIEPGTS